MIMTTLCTPYGKLNDVEFRSFHPNDKVEHCIARKPSPLKTPFGTLIPQYEAEDMGRRSLKPIYFHSDGSIKSMALQSQTILSTPVGDIPAEFVTFHPNGSIRRLFPLDGKLSGFWSWKHEFALASTLNIPTPAGTLEAKIIALHFYESGALKSVTLWPNQKVNINTPFGLIEVRKGIAFYESGALRSFEPSRKTALKTPIGTLMAYDNDPNGIHGDVNSVQLRESGAIASLRTIDHAVRVMISHDEELFFEPGVKRNVCGDERKIQVPMSIRFDTSTVTFHENPRFSFDLTRHCFEILDSVKPANQPSYSCAG